MSLSCVPLLILRLVRLLMAKFCDMVLHENWTTNFKETGISSLFGREHFSDFLVEFQQAICVLHYSVNVVPVSVRVLIMI